MTNSLKESLLLPSQWWTKTLKTVLVALVALLWLGACNTNAVDADPKVPQESVDPTDRERLKSPQDFSDLVEREKLESAQKFYDRLLQNKGKVIYRVIEETAPSDFVHYCFTVEEKNALMAHSQEDQGHYDMMNWGDERISSFRGQFEEIAINSESIKKIIEERSDCPYSSPVERNFFREKAKE